MTETHWTTGVHHDGSSLYVSNPLPALNETVTLRLRTPLHTPITAVYIRSMPDGEVHMEPMQCKESTDAAAYWEGPLAVSMPQTHYSFLLITNEGPYHYNALQCSGAPLPDFYDFKLVADFAAPHWLIGTVFYQIFPDRFHNGDPSNDPQPKAWTLRGHSVQKRAWTDAPLQWQDGGSLDFYGGDLPGVEQKLDYLNDLGFNAVYLNPIFKSKTNHRYNIDDFYAVDRHLGGDEALVSLSNAMHRRDMKLILDITPNHSSDTNPWFTEAQQNPDAPTADYYTFYNRPDEYETWLGVPILPKLNYSSPQLREQMYAGQDAILRYWLKPPFKVDGWRLDVYNMTARQGSLQLHHDVGREMRQAVKAENPQAYLFGEHFFDATEHLQGDQLDAVMNYRGFTIPIWHWLAGYDRGEWEPGESGRMSTAAFVQQLDNFRAPIPWVIARQQFNQLDSHDTRRIMSIVDGHQGLAKLAATLLMTYPGVPCVYYGDEIGLEGEDDPNNRRPMPWDQADEETDIKAHYRRLISLRKREHALRYGGYQLLYGKDDVWCFQRQSPRQQIIVVGYRGYEPLESRKVPVHPAGVVHGAILKDLLTERSFTAEDGYLHLDRLEPGGSLILEVK